MFAKSIIARENSRKLGEKLRPIWEKGKLENAEQPGQISETFRDDAGNRRENIALNVDVPALVAMLKRHIAKGVDEFFTTFGQAMNKYDVSTNVFHIVLAGNSSRSPLVMQCFREKMAEVLGKNETGDKIVLHPPRMPDPANPEAVTLKTGVAIGLLHILPGRSMGMVPRQNTEEEAYFPFTLGPMRNDALKPVLKRNAEYGEWREFGQGFPAWQNDFLLQRFLPCREGNAGSAGLPRKGN